MARSIALGRTILPTLHRNNQSSPPPHEGILQGFETFRAEELVDPGTTQSTHSLQIAPDLPDCYDLDVNLWRPVGPLVRGESHHPSLRTARAQGLRNALCFDFRSVTPDGHKLAGTGGQASRGAASLSLLSSLTPFLPPPPSNTPQIPCKSDDFPVRANSHQRVYWGSSSPLAVNAPVVRCFGWCGSLRIQDYPPLQTSVPSLYSESLPGTIHTVWSMTLQS